MKKIILWLARPYIIKTFREKSFGKQFINTILEDLDLPQTGVPLPAYHPPPPPPKEIYFSATEALQKSYLSLDETMKAIKQECYKNKTTLPYVLISHDTAEAFRSWGYEVREHLGGGNGIPKGVSTIKWIKPTEPIKNPVSAKDRGNSNANGLSKGHL